MASDHPYDWYEPYGSRNNGLQLVQVVSCISLVRLRVSYEWKQWHTSHIVGELHSREKYYKSIWQNVKQNHKMFRLGIIRVNGLSFLQPVQYH